MPEIEPEAGIKFCPACTRVGVMQYYVSRRYECFRCGEAWTFDEWLEHQR
jgi:ribosomal protein S27AE